ncbi:MAG TPA: hypothetical protein VFF06_16520 [Polyangia bacterium]|nr:hypothetical protein [Polyangia bacterium]
MDLGILIAPLMLAGAVGVWAWDAFYSPDARFKRALKTLAFTPMREARDGRVNKIAGTLEYAAAPLTAPLSGRACAWYEVIVEELKGRGGPRQILREERRQLFFLRDADGTRALVRTAHARTLLVKDANFSSGTFNDPSPVLEEFMRRHGIEPRGLLFNRSLRFREGVLEAGERVVAAGVARWEADADSGSVGGAYRETPRRLVLDGSEKAPLLISDDPSALR